MGAHSADRPRFPGDPVGGERQGTGSRAAAFLLGVLFWFAALGVMFTTAVFAAKMGFVGEHSVAMKVGAMLLMALGVAAYCVLDFVVKAPVVKALTGYNPPEFLIGGAGGGGGGCGGGGSGGGGGGC